MKPLFDLPNAGNLQIIQHNRPDNPNRAHLATPEESSVKTYSIGDRSKNFCYKDPNAILI